MKPVLTHPSYHDIEKGCALLATQLIRNLEEPEMIVGLARGGLVPSVILSHILGVKMMPVSYSSKRGQGEYKAYDNALPVVPFKYILLMDDIIDSGFTMREVCEHYESKGHHVNIASLYYKDGAVIKPQLSWQDIPKDSPWIIFPWEA